MSVTQSKSRELSCVNCFGCDTPCEEGTFVDPFDPFRCIPCRCNRHGDVCNARTGFNCGYKSQGCNSTSSSCICGDGVQSDSNRSFCPRDKVSRFKDTTDCQCNRCNSSFPIAHDLYTKTSKYMPLLGRKCYNKISLDTAVRDVAPASDSRHWFVDYYSLQYQNLPAQFVVYITSGSATVIVSRNNEFIEPNELWRDNYTVSDVLYQKENATKRTSFLIAANDFNTTSSHKSLFFIHILCDDATDCKYSMYCKQGILRLDLLVFFSMFASAFSMAILLVFGVAQIRKKLILRQQVQERMIELRQMALRPMGRILLALPEIQNHPILKQKQNPMLGSFSGLIHEGDDSIGEDKNKNKNKDKDMSLPIKSDAKLSTHSEYLEVEAVSSPTPIPNPTSNPNGTLTLTPNPLLSSTPSTSSTVSSASKYTVSRNDNGKRAVINRDVMTPMGMQPLKKFSTVCVTDHLLTFPNDRFMLAYALTKFPKPLPRKRRASNQDSVNTISESSL